MMVHPEILSRILPKYNSKIKHLFINVKEIFSKEVPPSKVRPRIFTEIPSESSLRFMLGPPEIAYKIKKNL